MHRSTRLTSLALASIALSAAATWVTACETTVVDDAGRDAPSSSDTPGTDGARSDAPIAPMDVPVGSDGGVRAGDPLFVAQGHVGRTIVSCDDGRAWVGDTSLDDGVRCWQMGDPREVECDHHPGSSKGLLYGRERFFGSLGWGMPGGVRRGDGSSWTVVLPGTTFGDVAYGRGTLLLASRMPRRSLDEGDTFEAPVDSGMTVFNVRRAGFGDHAGGVFVMVGEDSGTVDIVLSGDGATWTHPDTLPAECGHAIQTDGGIAYGNGVLLILGGDGVACSSTDGGRTLMATNVGVEVGSHLVFDGTAFVAFARGERLRSTDGVAWTREPTMPPGLNLGAIAHSPETGTLVGILGGWQVWYDRQEMYRSTDGGLTWTTLGDAAFPGGHPIRNIAFGYGTCPSP